MAMFASVIGIPNICSLNDTNRHIQRAVLREKDIDEVIAILLKQGDPNINIHTHIQSNGEY